MRWRYRPRPIKEDPRSVDQIEAAMEEIRYNLRSLFALAPRPPKKMNRSAFLVVRKLGKEYQALTAVLDKKLSWEAQLARRKARREAWLRQEAARAAEVPF